MLGRQCWGHGTLYLAHAQDLHTQLALCKDFAFDHTVKLVLGAWKVRVKVVEGLVSDTRVFVATMDVFCTHRVGCARGVAKGVLEGLNITVVLCDESEAYFMVPALAGLVGTGPSRRCCSSATRTSASRT